MTDQDQQRAFEFLLRNGYQEPKLFADGRLACIQPFIFTAGIITLDPRTYEQEYDERYCYHSIAEAKTALAAWKGTGEPNGWHRHLPSNRRRMDGDPAKEYVAQ